MAASRMHWTSAIIAMGRIGARQQAAGLGGIGVSFLAKPVMALHCGSGGLGEKMTQLRHERPVLLCCTTSLTMW